MHSLQMLPFSETKKKSRMNTNVKRLRKELQELKKNPEEDMVLYPEEDTIMRWKAFIRGPKDTPFEDRSFELAIQTTPLYPMEPPKMKFITKIFHPNVHFKVRGGKRDVQLVLYCGCCVADRVLLSSCWGMCVGRKHLFGYSETRVVACMDAAGAFSYTMSDGSPVHTDNVAAVACRLRAWL